MENIFGKEGGDARRLQIQLQGKAMAAAIRAQQVEALDRAREYMRNLERQIEARKALREKVELQVESIAYALKALDEQTKERIRLALKEAQAKHAYVEALRRTSIAQPLRFEKERKELERAVLRLRQAQAKRAELTELYKEADAIVQRANRHLRMFKAYENKIEEIDASNMSDAAKHKLRKDFSDELDSEYKGFGFIPRRLKIFAGKISQF